MAFKFNPTGIEGLTIIDSDKFGDKRGFFMETFRESLFFEGGIKAHFKQDNCSFSTKGVLRGLHYQLAPHTQGKLVRVVEGSIWDVALDIRKNSPTFGKWHGVELNEDNNLAFYIPPGFAHGFVVLSDVALVIYKSTEEYKPESERGIRWNDPAVGIKWPTENPKIAERDANFPLLKDAEILS